MKTTATIYGTPIKHDLINAAYKALDYSPTKDSVVINDRVSALSELSEGELLNIVKNCFKSKNIK